MLKREEVRVVWRKLHDFFFCVPRQAEVAQGVPGRLRPRIFLTFRHYKGGRSSAKRTGRLYSRRNPWYSLSDAESTSGHMVLSGEPRKKSTLTPPGIDPGKLHDLHFSNKLIQDEKCETYCTCTEEEKCIYNFSRNKIGGKRPLGSRFW